MTLKALFESSCRDFITFKGGTSLSKGWHVIERFSEDIDIAIDKSFGELPGTNKSRQRSDSETFAGLYRASRLVAEMQALLEGYGASDFELRAVPAQDFDADPTLVPAAVSKHLCEYRVCGIANPDRIQPPVDERTA
ncbi:MAG: nucleotidyl transferase AbiEii/AbiGii toxin family protein [Alistipes finegoldii]